jgi:hypothetical protein
MKHASAVLVPATGRAQSSSAQQNNMEQGGLSSARLNKFESGHSVASLSFPDPVPPSCNTEAPAPSSSSPPSWNQTLKLLVAQSSAISLSPPPSPPATKRPSATYSDGTAKRVVRFEDQQNETVSPSPCIPPTTCAHNSCRSAVAMTTTRRRYQRRNSKTPAMLMQSMSTSHASQPLPSQSLLSSELALDSYSIPPNTFSTGNALESAIGSTVGGATRSSVLPNSNASNDVGSTLLGMPLRIVPDDIQISMKREESSGECCKRRKLI